MSGRGQFLNMLVNRTLMTLITLMFTDLFKGNMTDVKRHQKLPNNWVEREKLRNKGQFWTPDWVAEAMVTYVIANSQFLFDPATGNGAFYSALKQLSDSQHPISFYGTDIDENVINHEIYRDNSCVIEIRDFIFHPPERMFNAIVANPPYIRHHRLSEHTKAKLREITRRILGFTIDGRAGLHIYFLIQALHLLEPGGKLAFIMPADTVEGIFAEKLWQWITQHFRLECVVTFAPEATPFPDVDTNALIFLIKNEAPTSEIVWVKSKKPDSTDLKTFVQSGFHIIDAPSLDIVKRNLQEALRTGLSRPPMSHRFAYTLADFARVMRGIVTGANEFFFLTRKRAEELQIPEEFLKPAIGRTRDIEGSDLTPETLFHLEEKDRPTCLFAPDGRRIEEFPDAVQTYLRYGEKLALPQKVLIKTRNPWYKMEQRTVPPFLFAYLGRRNARFIRNEAGVVPLTCFLCVYPHSKDEDYINKLWEILKHPETIKNLSLVGKSYGSGAIKVEPRSLENLPIPEELVEQYHLVPKSGTNQLMLFE
jgi:adenine-specific DNA-methyltransferase